jgi:N-acetylmuramoyl-L-alanine amidase
MMRRPAFCLLLLLAAAFLLPSRSTAQPAVTWRMETIRGPEQVRESRAKGYAALPLAALVGVGAELAYEGESVVARFPGGEARFTPGSREVSMGGGSRTLADPVYAEDGGVFVPVEFFTRHLAEAAGGTLRVTAESRTVAMVPLAERAPHPAPAAAPAGGASLGARLPSTRAPVRRRLVVVDAGHGGVDPGAHGPEGTREKDINLRVARMLAALLREDPTLDVRMTRDRDTLIALHDRARFANRWRADGQPAVFISIHCNANESRSEKGFETYFLAEARTADARRVERFENASVQYEERTATTGALAYIFTDLRQNHYLRESSDWAQIIQDGLRGIHPGPSRGVKQAGFAVLRGTFMPSVLVEIGFISNRQEEQLLLDEHMQRSIAQRLADSIHSYFDRPAVRSASN